MRELAACLHLSHSVGRKLVRTHILTFILLIFGLIMPGLAWKMIFGGAALVNVIFSIRGHWDVWRLDRRIQELSGRK